MDAKFNARTVDAGLQQNPFDRYMDFHVAKVGEEGVVLTFNNAGDRFNNPNGTLYGGILYSLADSAMGTACTLKGKAVLTLDLSMNYFAPAHPDSLIRAVAHVLHNGRTTMAAVCDFYDEKERYLAHGKGTFFVTESIGTPVAEGDEFHG